jgi:hypothetical protein
MTSMSVLCQQQTFCAAQRTSLFDDPICRKMNDLGALMPSALAGLSVGKSDNLRWPRLDFGKVTTND